METPEHVQRLKLTHARQQAMDAVSHSETMAQIRAYQDSGIEAAPGFTPAHVPPGPTGPVTDDIRRQAMDAVSHHETMASVRLVETTGSISPGHTPSAKNSLIAERIAEMHKTGQSIGAIQNAITKDNFGRENEIG
jgi:hypothetical protein